MNVFKANDIVVALLQEKARCCTLRKCSTAIRAAGVQNADHLPRDAAVVRQHGSESLRAQSLKEIKGVQWIPDWGRRVSSRWLLTVLTGVSPVSALGRTDVTVRA